MQEVTLSFDDFLVLETPDGPVTISLLPDRVNRPGQVRLGIQADRKIPIIRAELYTPVLSGMLAKKRPQPEQES
jgi:sRNA-binding carbon storage regulator CsrA